MEPWQENRAAWSVRYHVPRSQVWEGSRGGQAGNVHLHLPLEETAPLVAVTGRRTTLTRKPGSALCGKPVAWYDRPPNPGEARCPACVRLSVRYGLPWPGDPDEGAPGAPPDATAG